MIEFDKLDRSHKPSLVLRLLAENQISVGKACQWLNDYQQDEIEGDLPELMESETDDYRNAARERTARELYGAALMMYVWEMGGDDDGSTPPATENSKDHPGWRLHAALAAAREAWGWED